MYRIQIQFAKLHPISGTGKVSAFIAPFLCLGLYCSNWSKQLKWKEIWNENVKTWSERELNFFHFVLRKSKKKYLFLKLPFC